jgi:ATP-dependent Clp protease ATP-binding subunit ClpC
MHQVVTTRNYARSIEHYSWLERYFQPVQVVPASESEAIQVLLGIKHWYENSYAVTYTEDALQYAVYYSSSCIKGRQLPGKAVDLLDEAGASVNLRQTALPAEIIEVQKRIKFIVHRMENAIANHEFDKAPFYSDEERKERENLRALCEKYHLDEAATGTVSREDIERIVAGWTGLPVEAIRQSRADLDDQKGEDS